MNNIRKLNLKLDGMNESPRARCDLNSLCQAMHHPSIYEIFFLIIHNFFLLPSSGNFMCTRVWVMTGWAARLPPITRLELSSGDDDDNDGEESFPHNLIFFPPFRFETWIRAKSTLKSESINLSAWKIISFYFSLSWEHQQAATTRKTAVEWEKRSKRYRGCFMSWKSNDAKKQKNAANRAHHWATQTKGFFDW